jgi:hypothetical protein
VSSTEEGRLLCKNISESLSKNGFNLRKWASSDPLIVADLPAELKQDSDAFNIQDEKHSLKILGIEWRPIVDVFSFKVAPLTTARSRHTHSVATATERAHTTAAELEWHAGREPSSEAAQSVQLIGHTPRTPIVHRITSETTPHKPPLSVVTKMTKREMLSDLSKIFDPLGLLTPVTFKLKLAMQRCWVEGVSWDCPLSDDLKDEYLQWRNDLGELSKLKIPRCVLAKCTPVDTLELHVFTDASENGYSACIFVKVCGNQQTKVTLLTAKSKVAPLKSQSIPRLELCGLALGSLLVKRVCLALKRLGKTPDSVHA